jgi:branched-chain amino acid transport system substrate-binding protein
MYQRSKTISILALTLLLGSILINCAPFLQFTSTQTVTIAVVDKTVSTNGDPNAQSIYAGAMLAVEEFNKKDKGFKVNLVSYGDDADPAKAQTVAGEIVKDKVVAVIGHSTNETALAAATAYDNAKIPFVSVNPTVTELTAKHPYAFRVMYSAEEEAAYLATYLRKVQGQDKASIIYTTDQYGSALKQQFTNTFKGLGGSIVLSENASTQNVTDIVNKFIIAASGNPGTVFIAADEKTAATLLIELKRKGVTYPIMGASTMSKSEFMQGIVGKNEGVPYFVDGVTATCLLIFDSADTYANDFLRAYQSLMKKNPSDANNTVQGAPDDKVKNGYDATLTILAALERTKAGGSENETIFTELSKMETPETGVRGLAGSIYFDLSHNVARSPRFGIYQNGNIVSGMIQFIPITRPEQFKTDELKKQIESGRITTVDGKYVYVANIVYSGIDIVDIQDVDIKTSTYKMDFYMWVRYRSNSQDDAFKPADIIFSNATSPDAVTQTLIRPAETDKNGITTETYRVTGTFKNQFLFYEYPFDRQKLVIQFRNQNATTSFVQYVVDRIGMKDTGGDSLMEHFKDNGAYASLFGWRVADAIAEQSIFSTTSTLGDPQNFGRNTTTEFSLINVGIDVQRTSLQFIIKSLLPLLFTLVLAYITFFLPLGHSERLGVGSTALLTTAFFHLNLASSLPEIGYTVAMEYLFYAAYAMSALIVLLETISIRYEKRSEEVEDEKEKKSLQDKRIRLNMIGRFVYPFILVLAMLGGVGIYYGAFHLEPNKETAGSLVDKIVNLDLKKTQNTVTTSDANQGNNGVVTLRFGTWRPEDTEPMNALLKTFEQYATDHGKKINIQYEAVMGANYRSILLDQLGRHSGPDVFFVYPYDTRLTQYLEPLNNLPIADNFDASKSEPWKGSDNQYYAMPYVGVVQGVYYNKSFFASHPEIASPDTWKTWDDLLVNSQKIKDAGKIPFANLLATSQDSEMFQSILVNFVGGAPGREKYSLTGSKHLCFDSRDLVSAFQAVADLKPFILNAALTPEETAKITDDTISKQYFIDQRAVMLFGGSWDLQLFDQSANFDWSVFAPPAPQGKDTFVIFQPDVGVGINNDSAHKAEAEFFLNWLMNEGVQETQKNLPGRYLLVKNVPASTSSVGHEADFAKLAKLPSDIRWMFTDVDGQYPRSSEILRAALYQLVTPDSEGNTLPAVNAARKLQAGLGEWYEPAQVCR